jgi:outer membrane protein TolC
VSAGAKTIADQYQQEAIVAGDQLVVEADRAWQVAQADLVQTLQLDPARAYAFEWPAVALDTLASDAAPLDRLLSRAWTRRADLDAVDARVAASRQNVRVAGAASWPSLDANAGYGSSYSSNATGAVSDQFDDRAAARWAVAVATTLRSRRGVLGDEACAHRVDGAVLAGGRRANRSASR